MGAEALLHHRDHRELDGGAEPVDLPGGRVRRRRHRQAAAAGGQALQQHRQVVAEDHAAGARDHQRGQLLRRRRDALAAAAALARAARGLPEVLDGLPREEAARLPPLLFRLGSRAAGDPWSGVRLAHHPGPSAQHLRQHQECQVRREGLRQDFGVCVAGGRVFPADGRRHGTG